MPLMMMMITLCYVERDSAIAAIRLRHKACHDAADRERMPWRIYGDNAIIYARYVTCHYFLLRRRCRRATPVLICYASDSITAHQHEHRRA